MNMPNKRLERTRTSYQRVKPMKVHVPDIDGPTVPLCWQQTLTGPNPMVRCDRKKGHSGLHTFEYVIALDERHTAIEAMKTGT